MECIFFVPDIDKESFGQFVKELRIRIGDTQKNLNLINLGNISEQSISQWENGKKIPDINTFLNLCHFFMLSPDTMLCGKIKTFTIDLPEPLHNRFFRKRRFLLLHKKGNEDFTEQYLYYPKICETYLFPYFFFMKSLNLTYEEAVQRYLCDMGNIHLVSGQPYEVPLSGPKLPFQRFYSFVDDELTYKRINSLLKKYNIKDETLQILLGYKSVESIRRLKRGDQKWGIDNIYKLSWILDLPFEQIIIQKTSDNPEVIDSFFAKEYWAIESWLSPL